MRLEARRKRASGKKIQTIGQALEWGLQTLRFLGSREARTSSERILGDVLGFERVRLYLEAGQFLPAGRFARFRRLVSLRKKRFPLAYILKKAAFWNETLDVGPGCLIPRPETEILVEKFIERSGFRKDTAFSFLDLGCGSGAIGIALLRHFSRARGVLSDISRAALKVTQGNLGRYGLLARTAAVHSDLFKGFVGREEKGWDAIVSNPPYVADGQMAGLDPEVRREPKRALSGGPDGLFFYRRIAKEACAFLKPGGILMLEMGYGQDRKIQKLIQQTKRFSKAVIFKDYAGIPRVLMARAKKAARHG